MTLIEAVKPFIPGMMLCKICVTVTFPPKSRGTKGSNKTQNDQHEKEREETDLFVHT